MKKITTVELMENNVSLGHAPVIEEKGKRSQILIVDGKPITFKTTKEAKKYGNDHIESKN